MLRSMVLKTAVGGGDQLAASRELDAADAERELRRAVLVVERRIEETARLQRIAQPIVSTESHA
jgi:hypothetical protein